MKEIPLTQGKVALVDDEDFEYLNQWKWYAQKNSRTFYAVRQTYNDKGEQRIIQMHRVLTGTPVDKETDHKDHDGLNNQKHNLSICTKGQNQHNRQRNRNNSSCYKGVSWDRFKEKWASNIQFNKKSIYLGYFSSEKEAALAYNVAAKQYFGNYAYLNPLEA